MNQDQKTLSFLSNFVIYSKYANYLNTEKRRQTWEECVTVVKEMHQKKYPQLHDEIEKNFKFVYDKKVLPSMRSIHFGGVPIEFAPNRIFNCSYAHIDHPFVFAEIAFLLLGGSGVGYSVQQRHISDLPKIKAPKGTKRFLIGDSIEGISDSFRILVDCYIKGKPYPIFDYRDIRPEGELIKKVGSAAPGPKKFEKAHQDITRVFEGAIGRRLTDLEVSDVVCYIANSIVAGGIRDAALIVLFDKTSKSMLNSKSDNVKCENIELISEDEKGWNVSFNISKGQPWAKPYMNGKTEIYITKKHGTYDYERLFERGLVSWFYLHPQRGRANISIITRRDDITEDEFKSFMKTVETNGTGEPGLLLVNDYDNGTNPCLSGDMLLRTEDGDISMRDLWKKGGCQLYNKDKPLEDYGFQNIINHQGVVKATNVYKTGMDVKITKVSFSDGGNVRCTDNHRFEVHTDTGLVHKKLFELEIGDKIKNWDDELVSVVDVSFYAYEDSYCLTEPETNKIYVNGYETMQCSEIGLNSNQMCNLSTIVASDVLDQDELNKRAKVAAFIGTLQAGYTDFHYLRHSWKEQTEKEALLGVSMTGLAIGEVPNLNLEEAAGIVVAENIRMAGLIGINPSARTTTVKPEGCITPDTMINTKQGILSLEEIGDLGGEQWQNHNYQVYTDEGVKQSNKFYVNGLAETKLITLNSGINLEATLNHKFKIIRDGQYQWVETKNLVEGDVFPYSVGEYDGSEYQKLQKIKFEQSGNHKRTEFKQPDILDEDVAWFLGLYYADGSNHHGGIRIHGDIRKQKGFDRLSSIIIDKFGLKPRLVKYNKDETDNRCRLEFSSDTFKNFLAANDIKKSKSYELEIPLIIRKSPKSVIKAFVDGYLVGDGCAGDNSWSMVTCSKRLSEQMVIVMRAIGMDCKVREFNNKSFGYRQRYWIQERKGRTGLHPSSLEKWIKNSWKVLDENGLSNYNVDKIVCIQDSHNMTYDINVEENHTYLANSYVSHNSSTLAAGTLGSGIHAVHSEYFIRNIRMNKNSALYVYLMNIMPEYIEDNVESPLDKAIISIPIHAPNNAITRDEPMTDLLSRIKNFTLNWVKPGHISGSQSHNISATVSVKDDEWSELTAWMWENRENFNGLSVLPFHGGTYKQAPFIEINKETYDSMVEKFPNNVDFSKIVEEWGHVNLTQELACAGGNCEVK